MKSISHFAGNAIECLNSIRQICKGLERDGMVVDVEE